MTTGGLVIPPLNRRGRALRLLTFLAGLGLVVYALHYAGFGVNVTDSMPVGVYRVVSADRAPVKGDIVKVCPPLAVAVEARERDYMLRGPCPGNTVPLLKMVGATAGDIIDVSKNGIVINGFKLPGSAQQTRDTKGRPLGPYPAGRYRLPAGVIWLWTPNPRSWDSRYYGPVPIVNVSGFARLLFAFWGWPYAEVR